MNLGVNVYARSITPPRFRPGIGLRPGAEQPEIEELVPLFYAALYESIAMHCAFGLNVVAELGHHDDYSRPLGILSDCARRLAELPVLFVGVRCPVDIVMERMRATEPDREGTETEAPAPEVVPEPVLRWQDAVHQPGIYDMEVDTSVLTPSECAEAIRWQLERGIPEPSAFQRLTAHH
jgi:chloramphenicol 3-O phosphotransferase